ncbi:hypothetical protein [Cystobacter fuscus]|uniref:hypothetical protein n=1 Tax=Cystobacter fuscus TaxID=43 RepID=UPI0012DF08E9|nr:hypothetical protein [Cystobacter fuscus]
MRWPCLGLMLLSLGGAGACGSTGAVSAPRSGNAPTCTDDAREDDDTLEQGLAAAPISHIFNHGPARQEGRVACPGDVDWIHAHADCCNPSGARVRWDASLGPLEVELLDSEGNPIPLGAPGDIVQRQPGEVYLLRAEYGGRFLVRVRTSGEVAVPYSVELFAPVFVR